MKQNVVLIFLIAMTNTAFAGDIYKCTINGAVLYQAKPCKGVGNKLDIPQAYNPKDGRNSSASKKNTQVEANTVQESDAAKKAGLAIAQEAYQMTKNR
ncbi:hypothetical protein [Acinetobacter tjernbergiae]|uniref:DUF4124 domain-containing protein n=1 Tax=Acinetobacter tjernbergiae DSM 14971 = CIP 107465 TaxID=1120928 RepID=V2UZE7_9GAMM|nr:hypothetical protein [Acinetobacter tjernbergiae]ESK53986.1 hypothetical protein F990_03030 [Acinetobacter tjernbergiae DSM 14971 = CIP 107465]